MRSLQCQSVNAELKLKTVESFEVAKKILLGQVEDCKISEAAERFVSAVKYVFERRFGLNCDESYYFLSEKSPQTFKPPFVFVRIIDMAA